MSIKRRLKQARHSFFDYISFTQGEFRGTLSLLAVVIFLVALRWVLPFFELGKYNDVNAVVIENPDSLIAITNKLVEEKRSATRDDGQQEVNIPELEIEHSKFMFDPNTVSYPDLLKLGFDRKVASNIVKYREKGGKFKRAEDLHKIYGVDPEVVNALVPYVVLPESNVVNASYRPNDEANVSNVTSESRGYEAAKPVTRTKTIVDLNSADSAALVNVSGIGPTFASRIVKFRNRLGGFVSKEQLKEVYGVTPEHFETIAPGVTVDPNGAKKININTATLDELKSHVYFKYNVAKAIVAYREQHGAFNSKEDLKQVALVDDAFYHKIEPYIVVQ